MGSVVVKGTPSSLVSMERYGGAIWWTSKAQVKTNRLVGKEHVSSLHQLEASFIEPFRSLYVRDHPTKECRLVNLSVTRSPNLFPLPVLDQQVHDFENNMAAIYGIPAFSDPSQISEASDVKQTKAPCSCSSGRYPRCRPHCPRHFSVYRR